MKSPGSAIVDFGRFTTGFLVVMGIGTSRPSPSERTYSKKAWARGRCGQGKEASEDERTVYGHLG